jgi:hypothetical protein
VKNPRRQDIAAAALATLTTAASWWIASGLLETIPHVEDEFAYLWQAEVMAEGRVAMPSPPEPESFFVPFVVDHDGLRFGKYPPGWPALLAVGAAAGAPFWVNPLLAGLAVWLTYRLGQRLGGDLAGLLAALLTATSPMLLMLSGSLMPHVLSLVLTVGWMLAWFDLFLRPPGEDLVGPRRSIRLAAAVGSLGLMILTRPATALAVAIPFALHAVYLLVRFRRRFLRDVIGIGAATIALAALLPLWQWIQTGEAWRNLYTLYWPYDRMGFGPGIGLLAEGHTLHQGWINTRLSLTAWQHDLFGWPFLSWLFLPLWHVEPAPARRRLAGAGRLPVVGRRPFGVLGRLVAARTALLRRGAAGAFVNQRRRDGLGRGLGRHAGAERPCPPPGRGGGDRRAVAGERRALPAGTAWGLARPLRDHPVGAGGLRRSESGGGRRHRAPQSLLARLRQLADVDFAFS